MVKARPIKDSIAERLGGKWTYNRRAGQWENGEGATVCWVAACDCDDTCSHAPQLWVYGQGTPRRLWSIESLSKTVNVLKIIHRF